jgi:hypothetical protein
MKQNLVPEIAFSYDLCTLLNGSMAERAVDREHCATIIALPLSQKEKTSVYTQYPVHFLQ